nr:MULTISPECIES: condensation domain-containing protein [Rhizobium]
MNFARTLPINAIDAALFGAVPPIEALPRPQRVPLSLSQERWFSSRPVDGSRARHVQMELRLRGELNEAVLQSSLDGLVARHEMLRTTFGVDDGRPFQRIGPSDVRLPLKRDDLTAAADVEATLAEFMSHEVQATFDLDSGPLISARLLRLAANDHVLLITMHRMISDEQSGKILAREFNERYTAACEGRADQLMPLPVQYADYAVWQRRWLAGELLERHSEYRGRILVGAPTTLKLPTDRPRPARQDRRDSYVEFVLREPLATRLKAQSSLLGTTLFVTLLAGWALVLARLSGQDEIVIATPDANRTRSEIAGLIGPFVDAPTLRIDLSGDPTLGDLMKRVNAALWAQAYQDLTFEQVIELANPPRNESHTASFPAILAWQNNSAAPLELPGLEYVSVDERVEQHDLALEFVEVGEAIRGRLIYAPSLFERSTVEPFVSYLQHALSEMAVDLGQRVWSAALPLGEERHRLPAEPNPRKAAYPQDRRTHERFGAQPEQDPRESSVDCKDQSPSYRELRTTSGAPRDWSFQTSPINSDPPIDTAVMTFIEGTRSVSPGELQANSITRYHVTRFYREQITKSGYYNQLKYIVEPSFEEFESPGNLDTSGEHDNTVVPGFQHKYARTGLLLVTDRCASYCRYCFRKRIVGKDSDEIAADFAQIAQYIGSHPEMTNVLLSGGDPFMLSTARLDEILDHLLPFPHLESIRFGTKMVAYTPERFEDPALPALFQRIHDAGKAAVIVTHFDHIGEISVDAERNIRSLRACGVQFLNQSVLLGKVNDDAEILAATFAKCHQIGIRPYYLFQGRPVKGASHFQVSLLRGLKIVHGINQRLSGIQKTFKYIMSHYTGKIEILDLGADGRLYMRYHQNKAAEMIGKVFSRPHLDGACWLDDLPEA